jgi:hypothetical protein
MGNKAKGDSVKTRDEDMHTEHRGETRNEPTDSLNDSALDREAIALLAYFYWEGSYPHDSPHEDWFRAEAELRNGRDGAAID